MIGEGAARRVLPAPLHLIWRCALLLCSAPSMRARHSLKMYNGLVERCFMSCVDTFRRKTLEKNEEVVRVHTPCFCCACLPPRGGGYFAASAGLVAPGRQAQRAARLTPR